MRPPINAYGFLSCSYASHCQPNYLSYEFMVCPSPDPVNLSSIPLTRTLHRTHPTLLLPTTIARGSYDCSLIGLILFFFAFSAASAATALTPSHSSASKATIPLPPYHRRESPSSRRTAVTLVAWQRVPQSGSCCLAFFLFRRDRLLRGPE